jgi:hypothetical protein
MPVAHVAEQFESGDGPSRIVTATDQVDQPAAAAEAPEIAALSATIDRLRAIVAEQAGQLAELVGSVEWLALGACDRGGYSYETLRMWCATGIVASRREHGRVFANTRSLAAHLKRLGLAKAIKSA